MMKKSVKTFFAGLGILGLVFSDLSMMTYAEEPMELQQNVEEAEVQSVEADEVESFSVNNEAENAVMQTSNTVGWFVENGKKYYAITAGTKHKGWLSFGSTYYYCGSDGAIVTGKQNIGGKWYYFAEGQDVNSLEYGKRKTGWIEPGDGKKYYGMPDGSLRVGWLSFGSTYYYCRSDAAIVTGMQVIDGVVYEFNEDGVRQKPKTGWQVRNGKRYYVMPDGTYRIGWLSFGSTYYYCGSDGAIVTGKKSIGGKWYYFAEGQDVNSLEYGKRKTGWIEPRDGKKYYGMPDGSLRVGWLSFGSTYYYCGSDGAIMTGKKSIGGKWYYFAEGQDVNSLEYGKRKLGWIEPGDGKKYYGMPDGSLRVGWLSFGSIYYYCGNDAALICGRDYPVDDVLYTFNAAGVRVTKPGWGEYNGNKYYINAGTGFPETGKKVIDGKHYCFNKKGFLTEIDISDVINHALKPVGSTLYVWGGGWNAADNGSGETALTQGVWPEWAKYFQANKNGYSYRYGQQMWEKGDRSWRFKGLDCSGYLGWLIYNSANKGKAENGYVVKATSFASSLADIGYGYSGSCSVNSKFYPGDIVSIQGHCYLVLGQCSDGSVLIMHSTPNGGVQVSGTSSNGSNSKASQLAKEFMQKNYPQWWSAFGSENRQKVSASQYLNGTRFSWYTEGSFSDRSGIRKKSGEEIIQYLKNR